MADGGGSSGLRVLVVHDHPTNRMVLETILELIEAKTDSVEDGAKAVRAFRTGRYDVVLMDLQMPVMDGLTATRRIRQHERETSRPRTPIVVVSANSLSADRTASKAAGADDHLAKPVLPETLLLAISRATEALPHSTS